MTYAVLPPEGDQDEADELVRRQPVELPTYRLERVSVATLNVDYAAPYGNGYARPLSEYRLRQLRRDWDPLAVSPLTISRRPNGLWVIDGNHRRYIAYEKGVTQLPAMVHSGLTREREADLYTKLGTVLGQTPWTRFQSKLVSGDEAARDIAKIAQRHGLEVNATGGRQDGRIVAVARVEWIYARGGPLALDWVLGFLTEAFDGVGESLGEMQLEGTFMFYARYADRVKRDEIARLTGASGVFAWDDRAEALWQRVDVGKRSNTWGLAIMEHVNEIWRKQGKKGRQLLPEWERNLSHTARYNDVAYNRRSMTQWKTSGGRRTAAPQQLT